MVSEGFAILLSLATTRPASMAARARARLSNRPRSTSNVSMRLRGADMFQPQLGPVGAKPLGRKPHACLERGEVAPDVRRLLPRRRQRRAITLESMDQHEIVTEAEIFNRQ